MKYMMIDYIKEQPSVLCKNFSSTNNALNKLAEIIKEKNIKKIIFTGIGSGFTACYAMKHAIQNLISIPTQIIPSATIPYLGREFMDATTALIAVSRSGEKCYVLSAVRLASHCSALTIGITANPDSLMAKECEHIIVTAEGPEITYPKTKSVMTMMQSVILLAIHLSKTKKEEKDALLNAIMKLPEQIDMIISGTEKTTEVLGKHISNYGNLVMLGTGPNADITSECVLKFNEATMIHAEGNDLIQFIHGPIGAVSEKWFSILLSDEDNVDYVKTASVLLNELGSKLAIITDQRIKIPEAEFQVQLNQNTHMLLRPFLYLPPIQMIIYYTGLSKGYNMDMPENAKSIMNLILEPGRTEPEFRTS
jgi:glucosamine--fructose-6-phosphate aminotransferase (isomerizing)